MMCPDRNPCETWFGADGCLICRHGLVAEASNTTGLLWRCPLEILEESEKKKWKQFFEDWPKIKRKLDSYFLTNSEDEKDDTE